MNNTTIRRVQHTAVIGPQWGDEGKGKIVDMLAQQHDIIIRYGGGGNAGHTVAHDKEEFVLHLIPCGILHDKQNVIGNGCVVDLDGLANEAAELKKRGRSITPENLKISDRAHITTPYLLFLDLAEELAKGKDAVGTTLKGIGPTYQMKIARTGMRLIDLIENNDISAKLDKIEQFVMGRVNALGLNADNVIAAMTKSEQNTKMTKGLQPYITKGGLDRRLVLETLMLHGEFVSRFATDTSYWLSEQIKKGKRLMFEGAQGTFLDIDHGTYPHVTSSNTTIGGVYTGSGIYVDIANRLGVMKAYTTRVGNGEFPTELKDEVGERLRQRGGEYGATTGRPRRCGWLDLVMGKYAARVNGLNQLAMTKLDVLDNEPEIKVCFAYEIEGHQTDVFPSSEATLKRAKPIYETLPGWLTDTSKVRKFEDLPENARHFVTFVEQYLETPIKYISIGKERDQVIVR